MLSRSLEETLRRAMNLASSKKHEFATLEHLLFSLLEDKNAIEENKFYDEIGPEVAAIDNKFTKAIDSSKFKKELLAEFGEHYFNLISMELKSFDSKLVKLMKQEKLMMAENLIT